jgi:hypothetical protein
LLQTRNSFAKAAVLAAWMGAVLVSIWLTRVLPGDPALAVTAGFLFLSSLAVSHWIFGLNFGSAPMLYLILLGLFHLGLVFPWALGVYDPSRAPGFLPHRLDRAISLVIYAIAAYEFGLFVSWQFTPRAHVSACLPEEDGAAELFFGGSFLALVGMVMFVAGLIGLDPVDYYRLTYSETFRLRAESDPRFFGSGITLASIGVSIAIAGASRRRVRPVLVGSAVWICALLYWGFRGPALILTLISYVIVVRKGVSFPRWVPILGCAFLLVLLPVLRIAREQPDRFAGISFRDFNLLDGPAEMGGSIRPLIETAAVVGRSDYRYGRTYWLAIKDIVPNLALRWQAPETESLDDLPPSHWITAIVDPWTYKNGGGMGFSAVAEPYLNFGTPGLIVYFALLAFLLVKLERVSWTSPYALAAWALILGPLLWTTRNDFSNFFRPAFWGLCYTGAIRVFSGARVWFRSTGMFPFEFRTETRKSTEG